MKLYKKFLIFLFLLRISFIYPAVIYVSNKGNDSATGNFENPLASIQKAQQLTNAGDTVYIRGGNYIVQENQIYKKEDIWAYVFYLNKNGENGKRINYWAYPGETPVFDFSNVKPTNYRVIAFYVSGSWLHIKGIEVTGVQVTITTHTQSECFRNEGSNNIFEQLKMHDGMAIGFYLTKGSNNLILNCDAYRNHDYLSEDGKGGNVDGFGCHPAKGSTGNIFKGCRAWFNSDDGYDCISAAETVIFDSCWAFYNGYSPSFVSLGDGNGFKAGGYGSTAYTSLPNPIPPHIVRFCMAVYNKANGFYSNHHLTGSYWYNNTAYKNSINYNMLNRQSPTADAYLTDVDGYDHIMKNNLGYAARSKELDKINKSLCTLANNYFDWQVSVTADDFVSLDENLLISERKANGNLPDIDFMKLKSSSDLIDKGQDIGFYFEGPAPDLGAFELEQNYSLTVSEEGSGSVIVYPEKKYYKYGNKVQLTAKPDNGWKFDRWLYDLSGSNASAIITINGNKNVVARFVRQKYSIIMNINGMGQVVTVPDTDVFDAGSQAILIALPAEGWQFDNWSGDIDEVNDTVSVLIDQHLNISANFSEKLNVNDNIQDIDNKLLISTIKQLNNYIISFNVTDNKNVNIELYNLTGVKIKNLISGKFNKGMYKINFNLSDITPGIYIINVRFNDFNVVKKIVIN
jgi:hypothetical protein